MKLKTIDIRAFRLFGEQHLDFTNEQLGGNGSCANFVSIYAPNGFGKTSLFDAIEFGMTGNIHRLKLGNFDEQMKYDGKISDFSSFIHNKKMPEDKVFIRLGVEGYGNGEVVKEVEPEAEKNMLTGSGNNTFFTNAILSQDWFSEFLSATTAEERFRSFMRNFHQSDDLLEYHSTLKSTLTSLNREKGSKQRALDKLKERQTNDVDEHIVERLDEAFEKLKSDGIQIDWQRKIDEDSLIKLKLEIEVAAGKLEVEKRRNEQVLGNIQRLVTGQDELLTLEKVDTHRKDIAILKARIAENEKALEKVVELKSLLDQLAKLQQDRKVCSDELARLSKLISGYAQFRKELSDIEKLNREIKSCENDTETQKKELERIEPQLKETEKQKEELARQVMVLTNKLMQLGTEYDQYLQLLSDIENRGKKEVCIQAGIAKNKDERAGLEKRKVHLLDIQKKVTERSIDSVIEEYKMQCLGLIEINQRIKQKESAIKQEEDSINRQTAYKGQVEDLLVRARGMVNELKNGVCPLCGHDYGSTEALLKSIEDNNAVSYSIEEAMARIAKLKEEIEAEKKDANAIYQEMTGLVEQAIVNLDKEIAAREKAFVELNTSLAETQRIILEGKKTLSERFKDFEGLLQEQIQAQYEKAKAEAKKGLDICDKALTALKAKLSEISLQTKNNDQKRSKAQSAIQTLLNSEDYQVYSDLLKESETADDETLSLWNSNIKEKEQSLSCYDAKLVEAQSAIAKLKEDKVDLAQEVAIVGEIAKQKTDLTRTENLLAKTMQFIMRDCTLPDVNDDTPVGEIQERLSVLKKTCDYGAALAEKKKNGLDNLGTLIFAAGKYNQQQLLKKEIEKAEGELAYVANGQDNVKKEIARLQDYLTKYVKNFFQVKLINELYNRIDPHPEYKEVKFECDFSLTRPRLNVYMGSRDEKNDQIVPNLYFSTAQVNILSFCIFLAKAMFAKTDDAKDVGCIFIDDPIQALDDINILSMIDLLRNVAFTMNKQIVITTHDQNFFGLLQKKIPQNRFNACYWEIYERGKFRKVEA